jgi:hypothetical protein
MAAPTKITSVQATASLRAMAIDDPVPPRGCAIVLAA